MKIGPSPKANRGSLKEKHQVPDEKTAVGRSARKARQKKHENLNLLKREGIA